MTYSSGLVVVVKCKGKILREDKDVVTLPFNSEYSILLKNLESRRVEIKISIDGSDVLYGNSLVLDGNSESELKGFLQGNQARNKFKFIQKTKEISDHRGDKLDDGIIRVEYRFEKFIEKREILTEWNYSRYWYSHPLDYSVRYINSISTPNHLYSSQISSSIGMSEGSVSCSVGVEGVSGPQGCSGVTGYGNSDQINNLSSPLQDEGITVKGSEINQQFNYTNLGCLEDQSRVIILKLRGIKNNDFVKKPVTVNDKIYCQICGRSSKPYTKYCSNCGTFLE